MRSQLAAVVAVLGLALVGCDDDSDAPRPPPPPPPPSETVHKVGDLPRGWKVHTNSAGGFGFGVPPGWKAKDHAISTSVRSFDRLVAVSITPDRTAEAFEIPLANFARRALAALPGFDPALDPGPTRRFRHRYQGAEARASGRAESGVKEQVRLIVLRRDSLVTFTVVLAANAKPSARPSERLAERMVRTLRSRPIGAPSPGGDW
jgi:hypothetical protein